LVFLREFEVGFLNRAGAPFLRKTGSSYWGSAVSVPCSNRLLLRFWYNSS